jgi:hypothetical protein
VAREVGDRRYEGWTLGELGLLDILLTHRAEVEQLAGDPDPSQAALAEATDLAAQVSATPDSELRKRLAEVRALLGLE